jgi:hypothetical protein
MIDTLIIDGHYMFHRSKAMVLKWETNRKDDPIKDLSKFMEDERAIKNLAKKIVDDICFSIREISPKRTVITLEDSSWRKSLQTTYKANRTYDDGFDWNSFFSLTRELMNILSNNDIIVERIDNAEGDDLMSLWSNYTLNNSGSSMIIANDADITQLAGIKDDKSIVIYNNHRGKKLFHHHKDKIFPKTSSFKKLKTVKPLNIVFDKVFNGDGSDNIFGIELKNKRKHIISFIEYLKKNKLKTYNFSDAIETYFYSLLDKTDIVKAQSNLKIISLHQHFIPDQIKNDFLKDINQKSSKTLNDINYYWSKNILKGTKFKKD